MSLSTLLVLALVGAYLVYRGQQGEAARRDVDATTLAELARAGSDLAQPHDIEFYFYLPSQEQAAAIAAVLGREGYGIRMEPSDEGADWLCLATRQMLPDRDALHALRTRFVALAETHGGAYDGWGATVVERAADG